jgi:hypothetical protein
VAEPLACRGKPLPGECLAVRSRLFRSVQEQIAGEPEMKLYRLLV